MTAFWVVGIGINLVFAGALLWWAVRNWRGSGGSGTAQNGRIDRR
jgi:hypothetical protein